MATDGVILASTFAEADRPAVKDLVDAVAVDHGFRPPQAYEWLRSVGAAAARDRPRPWPPWREAAGLSGVQATELAVDTGVRGPADQVAYRLGMPHLSHFLSSLPPDRRERVVADALAAVSAVDDGQPLAPMVVFLSARVA